MKIRLTVFCAKLGKPTFLFGGFGVPDVFVKVKVINSDVTLKEFITPVEHGTFEPKWNWHRDVALSENEGLSISVWNQKKLQKAGHGFIGAVRLLFKHVLKLKDTGFQRLDLASSSGKCDGSAGHLVLSLISRDRDAAAGGGLGPMVAEVTESHSDPRIINHGALPPPPSSTISVQQRILLPQQQSQGSEQQLTEVVAASSGVSQQQQRQEQQRRQQQQQDFVTELPVDRGMDVTSPPAVTSPVDVLTPLRCESRHGRASGSATGGAAERARSSSGDRRSAQPTDSGGATASPSRSHQRRSARSPGRSQSTGNLAESFTPITPPYLELFSRRKPSRGSGRLRRGSANSVTGGESNGGDDASARHHGNAQPRRRSSQSSGRTVAEAGADGGSSSGGHRSRPSTSHSTTSSSGSGGGGGGYRSHRLVALMPEGDGPPADVAEKFKRAEQRRASQRGRRGDYLSRGGLHEAATELPQGYEERTTAQGQVYFLHVPTGLSTWHDPRVSSDLASVAEEDRGPLGAGWERRMTGSGRPYFVNHRKRTTQFTDPRLSANIALIQQRLAVRGGAASTVDERDVPPLYNRDLVQKLKFLHSQLKLNRPKTGHCRIEVSRDDIFENSYRQLMRIKSYTLRKKLLVKFRDELGLDYGGLAREWFYLLSHEMLSPHYGLFQYSREDIYTLEISPLSAINPEHLSYFHFIGRVIGMAIYHGHYLDAGFTLPFYRALLGKQISLDDIEPVDPQLHSSLVWILENDITGVIHNTFEVQSDSFGQIQSTDLKPNGSTISVNEMNKHEYVKLYVNWRYRHGIETQFQALQKGLSELIPAHLLQAFDERELELLISGLGRIDVEDWRGNTRLKHCTLDEPVVGWFWTAVESFDQERRARLLQFVTGSSRLPLQGFKALQGSTGATGPRLFTIHLIDASTDNLPKAHTCFNRIDIPPYESYEKLLDKLTRAVEETCGFAVE